MQKQMTLCDECGKECEIIDIDKMLVIGGTQYPPEITRVGPISVSQPVIDCDNGNETDWSCVSRLDFCTRACLLTYFNKDTRP